MKVLISTLFKGDVVELVTFKLSPDKLVLLVTGKDPPERKRALINLKKKFGSLLKIEKLKTSEFDVDVIAKDVVNKIREEKGNEIYIHISEARKTMFLGALFAAYQAKELIKAVYYAREDNNELMPLPLLDLKLSETKTSVLKEIQSGNKNAVKIAKKLGVHKSIVYVHINDLVRNGYLKNEKDLKLTPAGRIVVL